jgi:hypothetical protein
VTIPNLLVAAFSDQSRFDSTEWDILTAAAGGRNGVSSGCAVTAQGTPDMTVAVAAGTVVVAGTEVAVAPGNVTITAANGTNPRKDLIAVDNAGAKSVVTGTPAPVPLNPSIPANSVIVAQVYVPALDTTIGSTQITDKRVFVNPAIGATGWTPLSCAGDQSKTSDTTLANDSVLSFTMAASTKYRIRGILWFESASATPDVKLRHTGPASPDQVGIYMVVPNASSGLESSTNRIDNAYSAADILLNLTANLAQPVLFHGFIHNGSNPGTFAWQWAQNVSDASPTIRRAGSIMEYGIA